MNTCRNSKTPFFTGWVCLRERSICKPRQEPTPNCWGGETGRLMGVGTPAVTNQHYVHQRPAPALCVQAVSRKPKSPNTPQSFEELFEDQGGCHGFSEQSNDQDQWEHWNKKKHPWHRKILVRGETCWYLSMESLHVLLLPAWVFSGCAGFPP